MLDQSLKGKMFYRLFAKSLKNSALMLIYKKYFINSKTMLKNFITFGIIDVNCFQILSTNDLLKLSFHLLIALLRPDVIACNYITSTPICHHF